MDWTGCVNRIWTIGDRTEGRWGFPTAADLGPVVSDWNWSGSLQGIDVATIILTGEDRLTFQVSSHPSYNNIVGA